MEDPNVQLTRDALKSEAQRRRVLGDKLIKEPDHGVEPEEIVALLRTANLMEEIADGEIQLGTVAQGWAFVNRPDDFEFEDVEPVDILQNNAKDETDELVPIAPNRKPKTVKRKPGRPRKELTAKDVQRLRTPTGEK